MSRRRRRTPLVWPAGELSAFSRDVVSTLGLTPDEYLFDPGYTPLDVLLAAGASLTDGGVSLITNTGRRAINWTQATPTSRPALTVDSAGYTMVSFDGINHFMNTGAAADWVYLHNGVACTIFAVSRIIDNAPDGLQTLYSTCSASAASSTGFLMAYDNRAAIPTVNRGAYRVFRGATPAAASNTVNGTYLSQRRVLLSWRCGTEAGADNDAYYRNRGTLLNAQDWAAAPAVGNPNGALTVGALTGATSPAKMGHYAWISDDLKMSAAQEAQINAYLIAKYEVPA